MYCLQCFSSERVLTEHKRDCLVRHFCQKVVKENFNKPLKMTRKDREAFRQADHCHICEKTYTERTSVCEIIVTLLANTEAQRTETAISISS